MDMKKFIDTVRSADEDSVLDLLFECYIEQSGFDNDQIRQDFEALYEAMNGNPPGNRTKWFMRPVRYAVRTPSQASSKEFE